MVCNMRKNSSPARPGADRRDKSYPCLYVIVTSPIFNVAERRNGIKSPFREIRTDIVSIHLTILMMFHFIEKCNLTQVRFHLW